MILNLLAGIMLTMPLLDTAGSILPDEYLVVVIYDNIDQPVAADIAMPGEELTIEVPGTYGCWYATAWTIDTRLESAPSNTDCKRKETCYSCHRLIL